MTGNGVSSGRWVTIVQLILLTIALALSAYVATQAFKPKPVARPPRFGPRGTGGRGFRAQGPYRLLSSQMSHDHIMHFD